jgi:Ca-activated chloride channel family protein
MKRYLKKDQFQLSLREQEKIWRNIQTEAGGGQARRPRRFAMPAFGMTAVTAAALLLAVWLHDKDAPDKVAQQALQPEPTLGTGQVAEPRPAVPEKPAGTLAENEAPVKTEDRSIRPEPLKTVQDDQGRVTEQVVTGPKSKGQDSDRFATDSVAEALSKQAGVQPREGELNVRGGRSGEVMVDDLQVHEAAEAPRNMPAPEERTRMLAKQAAPDQLLGRAHQQWTATVPGEPSGPGSVTGGTTPPNGETFELMYHEHTGVNPFVATEEDALSTFAVDVDNASYTLARSYLQRGAMPPRSAIRVEEFVNFFGGGYPDQDDQVFGIHTDGSESRFGQGYRLLRVGLKGMTVAAENRKPANLIFVVDISGSMGRENRLGLVKQSLGLLLDQLQEGDRVGIVVYGNRGEVRLEPTGIEQRARIQSAIDNLVTGGATNACEGLEKAYELARRHYDAGIINRIILCSDGVANMGGTTRAEEMLATVRRSTDQGITLSTIGFGMGNYNDVLMEKLADQGDGNYHYVDKLEEAERVLRENLTGLLQTIARQVKVQVEFDPETVQRWRLLGYENRDVADRDFRNDAVDAGEVGAGHQVTALYELKVTGGKGDLGTVRVRYEYPAHDTARAGQVKEIEHRIKSGDVKDDFDRAELRLRLQAVAAEFAEILRGSYWAKESTLSDLVPVADGLARELDGNEQAAELAELIRRAAELEAAQKAREEGLRQED